MDDVVDRVRQQLAVIERKESVRIILAVESGSRAWGFPSEDSDYDVRFIYIRPKAWYLSIDLSNRPDVLEYPLRDLLDVSGWDLKKALQLLRKSNPPLLEWLRSPTVYMEIPSLADRFRDAAIPFFSPKACFYHYLHMAQGNYREFLRGNIVWRKEYFYVLRPVLAMRWLERQLGPVPMEFDRLVAAVVPEGPLHAAIQTLLRDKRDGVEMDRGPRIEVINNFLDSELSRFDKGPNESPNKSPNVETLNKLFLQALEDVWNE